VKRLLPFILAALLLAATPSASSASATQESMFQDDPMLVYGTPERVESTLGQLQAFGVDRIRVSVFWAILAPAAEKPQKPNFDATDPAAYPARLWEPYDRLIRSALAKGILVNLDITSPIPRWAAQQAPEDRLQQTWGPNAEEFGKFVQALGKRYSGTYLGLPRVDYWSIWNEPNQAGWLTPQWSPDPRNRDAQVESAPSAYRSLVATAWQGLAASGHGTDTILIGETAPQGTGNRKGITGSIDALRFLRQMYCLDDNLNLLKGSSAEARGCPQDPAQFVAQNPALFHATGYAHHPYDMLSPPARRPKPRDWVTMANLGDLSRELRRIYLRYGQKTQTSRGVPLYLTEYGYQTRPDPFSISFSRQAAWLNEAEYIASRNPNVRALSQFLLVDDAPDPAFSVKTQPQLAWRTFQTGLKSLTGKRKPSYNAYVTPLFVKTPRVRRGRAVAIFGMLRAARATAPVSVTIQWRRKGLKRWSSRRIVTVLGARHYLNTRVSVPATGAVRLRWTNGRRTFVSRPASVTVTG
jgi:Cellulase (glycosyl hydrolase family 5)